MRGVCDVIFAVNSRHVRLLGQPGLKFFFCKTLCAVSLPLQHKQLAERSAVDYTRLLLRCRVFLHPSTTFGLCHIIY